MKNYCLRNKRTRKFLKGVDKDKITWKTFGKGF